MNSNSLYAWLFQAENMVLAAWVVLLTASAAIIFRPTTSTSRNSLGRRHHPR